MKIYIVVEAVAYEGKEIERVFSTKEKADAWVAAHAGEEVVGDYKVMAFDVDVE